VDFNRVFPIPRSFVDAHVEQGMPRLRMNPPYREFLAQAFGNCYTRIGLPMRATEVTVRPAPSSAPASPEAGPGLPPQR
jgi:hypothetical protein